MTGGKSERLYRDHALGLPFEQKAAAARLGTGQADRRNDSSRLSAVTLEPLRPRAAHVVQLRSIAAVRQDGSDGPENGHKIHPRFPHAISPRVLWARVSANTWKLWGNNVKYAELDALSRPREVPRSMDSSCPGLTPQVGFSRLAELNISELGQARVLLHPSKKSASSKGVWIAGSEPRSWHRDRPQRPKVWTPDPNAANYWGAGAPEEMRK